MVQSWLRTLKRLGVETDTEARCGVGRPLGVESDQSVWRRGQFCWEEAGSKTELGGGRGLVRKDRVSQGNALRSLKSGWALKGHWHSQVAW